MKEGNPDAKVMGGSFCTNRLKWLHDVFRTGAGEVMDAFTYHGYTPDEKLGTGLRLRTIRAICDLYNPRIRLVQGETGTQSRISAAGALNGAAWTPERQAKFLARQMIGHLSAGVMFTSYFSCMDMVEALNGKVGEKSTWLDFGYFGVLAADFDENGVATGEYRPKPSYRVLQNLAAIFREDFSVCDLPMFFIPSDSRRLLRMDDDGRDLMHGGFRRPDGSSAFAYWKPSELLTTTYESTVSMEFAAQKDDWRLIDPLSGTVYRIPDTMLERDGEGFVRFRHLPLRDYPLILTFGDFIVQS